MRIVHIACFGPKCFPPPVFQEQEVGLASGMVFPSSTLVVYNTKFQGSGGCFCLLQAIKTGG